MNKLNETLHKSVELNHYDHLFSSNTNTKIKKYDNASVFSLFAVRS